MSGAVVERCPIQRGAILFPRKWQCCACGWPARPCSAIHPDDIDAELRNPYQLAMDLKKSRQE